MKKLQLLLITLVFLPLHAFAGGAETINIYSYHNHPPFVTGKEQGWTYQLAKSLNQIAGNKVHFKVQIVPRSRLNHYLKGWIQGECPAEQCRQDWIVPWVNPKWGFIKGERNNYSWLELFEDSNAILTLKDNPIRYNGPESLKGHTLAGMRGHRYVGIDALVERGEVIRIDGNRERDNILKLLRGRVDATLLPTSTINYLLQQDRELNAAGDKLRIAEHKHQIYIRHLMLPETHTDLLDLIKTVNMDFFLTEKGGE